MTNAVTTIAVIGAGFSGTITAVHLLKAELSVPLRILLIDSNEPGRGLAYGTDDPRHVLNVPAAGMSAFDDAPEDFVQYLQRRYGTAAPTEFVARSIYGDYLQKTLNAAIAEKSEMTVFENIRSTAVDIVEIDQRYEIVLSNGNSVVADKIVLALGNTAPAAPTLRDSSFFANSRRYIGNPWQPDLLDAIDEKWPILLIGTGLTAVDIVLKLLAKPFLGKIYAVSRHGLQPIAHRGLSGKLPVIDLPSLNDSGRFTITHITRVLRRRSKEAIALGRDWRDIIAALRPTLPKLWRQLSHTERQRLLRHIAAYWDVHRHRLAPSVAATFQDALVSKRLKLLAGRITALTDTGNAVDVAIRERGSDKLLALTVGTVINCTGPTTRVSSIDSPLLQSLITKGLIKVDECGLGISVADNYSTTSAENYAHSLFYIGPWLKAEYWEATAVPELRGHAKRASDSVLASLN
ncbi:MAG: FAD/NAD(P)-binding protein [Spongiibacteraceae bacterium]